MSKEASSLLKTYILQEQKIFHEFKSIFENLPKEKGLVAPYIYQYQGFWYSATFLQAAISLINRNKYPPNKRNHPLISTNPHDLVPFLEVKLYVNNQAPDLESLPSPRLFATHMPYFSLPESVRETRACKIVYLCRNPKDVLVSFWHFTNRFRSLEMGTNPLEYVFGQFCNGAIPFGPFWDHVLDYWNQSKENPYKIFFLKFEDLKRDPESHVRRLAEFLECPFSAEEEGSGMVQEMLKMCSFENLSGLEINKNGKVSSGEESKMYFRRGEVGDWKNYLTDEMVEKLDEICEKKFGGSGLVF